MEVENRSIMHSNYLHLKPENAYMAFFTPIVSDCFEKATEGVRESFSEAAVAGLYSGIMNSLFHIACDTLDGMRTDIVSRENLLAAYDRNMCTKQQNIDAARELKEKLDRGDVKIPEVLRDLLVERSRLLSEALSEMFAGLEAHKKQICASLFDGKEYSCFTGIKMGAGDYHRKGRCAVIIGTDAGKMVYKPRDCRTDLAARIIAEKYFPGAVIIPDCYTDSNSFGVFEYVNKSPARGKEQAGQWFYLLGKLSVMIKVLGAMDMHVENIIAVNGIPAIIDTETILCPKMKESRNGPDPLLEKGNSFMNAIRGSIWRSGLLPKMGETKQYSIMADSDSEYSSMPLVEGGDVSWEDYSADYFKGFRQAYHECMDRREELEQDIRELFNQVPVRLMLRNTQYYADLMVRVYKRRVLASPEKYNETCETLESVLSESLPEHCGSIINAEQKAILRGDIPFFYVSAEGRELYSDEGVIAEDFIEKSGIENALSLIRNMSEEEMAFEEAVIRESFACMVKKTDHPDPERAELSGKVISADQALSEAEEILEIIWSKMIKAPNGTSGWICMDSKQGSPMIMENTMGDGSAGLALFTAALWDVSSKPAIREHAVYIIGCVCKDLRLQLDQIRIIHESDPEQKIDISGKMGEISGLGGILRCFVLIARYMKEERYEHLVNDLLDFLVEYTVPAEINMTDRLGGIAGMIGTLSRWPELYQKEKVRGLIGALSDRMLELMSFEADGYTLWETISKRHLISGAGHGMMGIAEALYAADHIIHNPVWRKAAQKALTFEQETYSEQLGSWPDRRIWPPQNCMNGYCSGAPGIGIMCSRMDMDGTDIIASRAMQAVDNRPILYRDHLCCGNSAIVDYYLTVGNRKQVGRYLAAMKERKDRCGLYQTLSPDFESTTILSLFYGIAGIGYEMLRYAFPDKILPVL